MEELSIQGYWLGNSEGLVVSGTEKSNYSPFYSTQQYVLSTTSTNLCAGSHCHTYEGETRNNPDSPLVFPAMEEQVEIVSFLHPESPPSPVEAGELEHNWLNQPCFSANYKLMIAVGYLKQFVEDFDVLVQIWVPVHKGDTIVLTTNDQLYAVSRNSRDLQSYRSVSKDYQFPAEISSEESAGLPGRAFSGKLPEWSPDVRFFESSECPRLTFAKLYGICGCLAMPVFERGGGACVAVLEIVTNVQKMSYHLELENIYKVLEAVDLAGSQDFHPYNIMNCNVMFKDKAPEIAEVLESVCKSANLPLALTWALRSPDGKDGYDQIDDQYAPCISTVRSACFITDTELLGFYMACSEQYLSLDQGIVGKSFLRRRKQFSTDITCFRKSDYPLSHHAKIFGLRAALAIPLQNIHTGSIDFVLELFLPMNCEDVKEQKRMCDLLSRVFEQAGQSFHVVMDKEPVGDINCELIDASDGEFLNSSPQESSSEDSYEIPLVREEHKEGESIYVSSGRPKEQKEELDLMSQWYDDDDNDVKFYSNQEHFELGKLQQSSERRTGIQGVENSCIGQIRLLRIQKTGNRRAKTQKTISLQVIQQYFAESLKDAAKSIGVCPTTLKRICRQHGITRWPSRKIKKVNHSLKKLQLVVDSVQGAQGIIQIGSVLTAPKSLPKFPHNPGIDSNSQSSSSDQNHKSGLTCSKEVKKPFSIFNADASVVQDPVAVLKQTFSKSELCYLKDEPVFIDRSHDGQKEERKYHDSPAKLPHNNNLNTQDHGSFRVKANFREENIRFSMPLNWTFRDLQQEIGKRFNIHDFSRIHMKYIDNDDDTVHLDCDADLKEFKELFKDSLSNTIRISLHQASQ